jgi:hypothetical protein
MQIPDPTGNYADELAMNENESFAIGKTLARVTLSNSGTARIIAPLVENEDLIDTAIALWDYHQRTTKLLDQLSGRAQGQDTLPPTVSREGIDNGTNGQDAQVGSNGNGGPGWAPGRYGDYAVI